MEQLVNRYIESIIRERGVNAVMVTGSYSTGTMGPRSDIDLFCIWGIEFESMRGREYFEGIEFELFISPEWKYYDRLRTDPTSLRIYSTAKILLDPKGKLRKIQRVAKEKLEEYTCSLSLERKQDWQFWLETICSDGQDLFEAQDFSNFLYFTAAKLQKMNDLLCQLQGKLPTYEKYGVTEISRIDQGYGDVLMRFLQVDHMLTEKCNLWVELCQILIHKLGNYDLTKYERIQRL